MYQRMKNRTEVPVEKLKLSEMPKRLWTHLMVDFITKLPVVAEKNVILVTKGLCYPWVKDEYEKMVMEFRGLVLSSRRFGNRVLML